MAQLVKHYMISCLNYIQASILIILLKKIYIKGYDYYFNECCNSAAAELKAMQFKMAGY